MADFKKLFLKVIVVSETILQEPRNTVLSTTITITFSISPICMKTRTN